jgi:hypothetical protein
MTDKLNEFLAVEVMGWCIEDDDAYFDSAGIFQEPVYMFQPDKNIEQAMMCLEKFLHWQIDCKPAGFYVHIKDEIGISHESLPIAISLACARAKGWKDE